MKSLHIGNRPGIETAGIVLLYGLYKLPQPVYHAAKRFPETNRQRNRYDYDNEGNNRGANPTTNGPLYIFLSFSILSFFALDHDINLKFFIA